MNALVVDDDAAGAEGLTTLLRARGYDADWAANAEGALARMHLGKFDALVIDEYMTGLDGLGLVRQMREQEAWRAVPVVILTAAADEPFAQIERDLLALGPACALRKPAGVEEVLAAIEGLKAGPDETREGEET